MPQVVIDILGTVPGELRWVAGLVVVCIILLLLVLLVLDSKEAERLKNICWGYAGYDKGKYVSKGEEPSAVVQREGLHTEMKSLARRVGMLAEEIASRNAPVPDYIDGVRELLPLFFALAIHRRTERRVTREMKQTLSKIRVYCTYQQRITDPSFQAKAEALYKDLKDWTDVVERFGRRIGHFAEWEERYPNRY